MKKILILTLGTGNNTVGARGYLTTTYLLNGREYKDTSYIAVPLICEYRPDEIVIIGTVHSGWSSFYSAFKLNVDNKSVEDNSDTNLRILSEYEDSDKYGKDTTSDELIGIAERITDIYRNNLSFGYLIEEESLYSPEIHVMLLRYGMNDMELAENYSLLAGLKGILDMNDSEVAFDITHSFRSLPIYNISVLNYIKNCTTKPLRIAHVYYGNLEVRKENNDVAPIVDLVELINVLDMASGAREFVNTGNAVSLISGISPDEDGLIEALRKFTLAIQLNSFLEIDKTLASLIKEAENRDRTRSMYTEIREMIYSVLRVKMFNCPEEDRSLSEYYDSMSILDKRFLLCNWCVNQNRLGQAIVNCIELFRSLITPLYVEIKNLKRVNTEFDEKYRKDSENFFKSKKMVFKSCDYDRNISSISELITRVDNYKGIRNTFAHLLINDRGLPTSVTKEDIKELINELERFRKTIDASKTEILKLFNKNRNSLSGDIQTDVDDRIRFIISVGRLPVRYSEFFESANSKYRVFAPPAEMQKSIEETKKHERRGVMIAEYWNRHFAGALGEIVLIGFDITDLIICRQALDTVMDSPEDVKVEIYGGDGAGRLNALRLDENTFNIIYSECSQKECLNYSPTECKKGGRTLFVNFTNHPSGSWDELQLSEAEDYGEVVDIHFPVVPANANEKTIRKIKEKCLTEINELDGEIAAVLVQGESSLVYGIVHELKKGRIKVLAACSERNVVERLNDKGERVKETIFRFVRYREYK